MRWFFSLLAIPALASAAPLQDARVDVPFNEFRTLLEQQDKKSSGPKLEAAVTSSKYDLAFEGGYFSGTAVFDVQTFGDGSHAIPLVGDGVIVEAAEPAGAVLVRNGGFHCLVVEGRKKDQVTLLIHIPATSSGDVESVAFPTAPATVSQLRVGGAEKGGGIHVEDAFRRGDTWFLRGAKTVRVEFEKSPTPKQPKPPALTLPAIVRSASAKMRVVRDGALFNEMTWQVRHQAAFDWKVTMPPDAQFVSCQVDGVPAQPRQIDPRTVEIPLPQRKSGDHSTVEFSYTARKPAFHPVRGEIALELPATALLVERSDWELALPPGFETVAAEGNVEFEPSKNGSINLRKELSTGDAPSVRIFYQKPENTK